MPAFYRTLPLFAVLLVGACKKSVTGPEQENPSLARQGAGASFCTFNPVKDDGTSLFFDTEMLLFRATWQATANCAGSPIHGKTVEVHQQASLHRLGNGSVGGPTHITLVGLGNPMSFDGRVVGQATPGGAMVLNFRGSNPAGAGIRGSETMQVNRGTGTVTSFISGFFDIWY